MFVNMAFVNPYPGKENEQADRMRAFTEAFKHQPGILNIHALMEKGGNTVVGISMREDEDSFNKAMKNVETRPMNSPPVKTLRPNPPVVRQFYEI